MTVDVVHALEVVDVEHEQSHRQVRSARPLQLGAEALVEIAVIQKARQRVGLSLMLEPRAPLGVVERERGCVAEALRELELVLVELRVVADSVDVQRAVELTSRDERHDDKRLGIDWRSLDDANARIEVRLVRVHGLAILDGPAGDADSEGRSSSTNSCAQLLRTSTAASLRRAASAS